MLLQNNWILGLIFIVSAILIWVYGIKLSKSIDTIINYYGWGEAIGGIVFLAIITNLPEIAITAIAAYQHEYDIAVSNILGGIAIQTVVLVLIDIFGVGRKAPLTLKGHSNILVIEGLSVIFILMIVLFARYLPITNKIAYATPYEWIILFAWIGSVFWTQHLYTSRSIKKQRRVETAVVNATTTALLHKIAPRKTASKKQSIQSAIFITVFGAIIILVAGYGLEASGGILSKKWGMSGILFGSTILAFCTALPEISTGIASAKIRDYQMAVSDIFGGNAFLPTLFLMAAIIGGDTILPNLKSSDIYLTIVGMVLTSVYLVGMLFHSKKQYFRMGIDSIIVLILYIASIWGLVYLQ